MRTAILALLMSFALLAGCEMKIGEDKTGASIRAGDYGNVAISADDGEGISIKVSGFESKVDIPGIELGGDAVDVGGVRLYPGSRLHGINVTDRNGPESGTVDMRFTSPAAPDRVATYYAAAARDSGFTAVAVAHAGGTATLSATNPDGDPMTITMVPDKAGTKGHILIRERSGA